MHAETSFGALQDTPGQYVLERSSVVAKADFIEVSAHPLVLFLGFLKVLYTVYKAYGVTLKGDPA